jgi:hypothetical protein
MMPRIDALADVVARANIEHGCIGWVYGHRRGLPWVRVWLRARKGIPGDAGIGAEDNLRPAVYGLECIEEGKVG